MRPCRRRGGLSPRKNKQTVPDAIRLIYEDKNIYLRIRFGGGGGRTNIAAINDNNICFIYFYCNDDRAGIVVIVANYYGYYCRGTVACCAWPSRGSASAAAGSARRPTAVNPSRGHRRTSADRIRATIKRTARSINNAATAIRGSLKKPQIRALRVRCFLFHFFSFFFFFIV